jgi:hypothetical protein
LLSRHTEVHIGFIYAVCIIDGAKLIKRQIFASNRTFVASSSFRSKA